MNKNILVIILVSLLFSNCGKTIDKDSPYSHEDIKSNFEILDKKYGDTLFIKYSLDQYLEGVNGLYSRWEYDEYSFSDKTYGQVIGDVYSALQLDYKYKIFDITNELIGQYYSNSSIQKLNNKTVSPNSNECTYDFGFFYAITFCYLEDNIDRHKRTRIYIISEFTADMIYYRDRYENSSEIWRTMRMEDTERTNADNEHYLYDKLEVDSLDNYLNNDEFKDIFVFASAENNFEEYVPIWHEILLKEYELVITNRHYIFIRKKANSN